MEFIKPAEISAKIISLIAEADEELVIVSPYNNFRNWSKLLRYLNDASDRGVKIKYFVRKGEQHKGFEKTRIKPIEVENLHAKIYFNEKYAIVSSMNMVEFSDINSLDFAMEIDEPEMFNKVKAFYKRYILKESRIESQGQGQQEPFINSKPNTISKEIRKEVFFQEYFLNPSQRNFDTYLKRNFFKEYYPGTNFIKEFGFYNKKSQAHGFWFYFDENGFIKEIKNYDNGRMLLEGSEKIEYNNRVSLYWILASLANIVGGLYSISIKDLYFQSRINDFIKSDKKLLYDYLENITKIKFWNNKHETFKELGTDLRKVYDIG